MFGITKAPEIDRPGLVWFITPHPLSLARLRGRLVLLDFWTLCCVNCHHVQPTLRRLEELYGDALTVIGVHSPKFPAERRAQSVASAIARHRIRRIDRATGAVTTIAGTGQRGATLRPRQVAGTVALASPWDLALLGGRIFFANAGTHQIGAVNPEGEVCAVAGAGPEGLADGPATKALLAQPSGLAAAPDEQALYFVDAESSAVRRLILGASPWVETLAGQGLFAFGHRNGTCREALFQHPLGLDVADGRLLIADSFNDSLRAITIDGCRVDDLGGAGWTCADAVCRPPSEPSGVAAAAPLRWLVSDTNNHRVLEYRGRERVLRTWCA